MNCIKGSWDIFTPNWSQKAPVTCVTVHLEESLTRGECETANCVAPWKISLLGDSTKSSALPMCCSPSSSFCLPSTSWEETGRRAQHLKCSWIIHRLWSKRLSRYITILEDFHQILPGCYRADVLISACSCHVRSPLGLSGSGAFFEKQKDTASINSACEFLCAWPVSFSILNFSELVLIFQLDNFPIGLLWCERARQHFPIGTAKSRGRSPRKSSPAVTLLRSSKGRSRFSLLFPSALCFSLLSSFGWCLWHITAQCSCAPASCTRAAAGARPAYCHLKETAAGVRRDGVRECLFIVLSLTGPQRYACFSFWVLRSVLREDIWNEDRKAADLNSVLHLASSKALKQKGQKRKAWERIFLFCLVLSSLPVFLLFWFCHCLL